MEPGIYVSFHGAKFSIHFLALEKSERWDGLDWEGVPDSSPFTITHKLDQATNAMNVPYFSLETGATAFSAGTVWQAKTAASTGGRA